MSTAAAVLALVERDFASLRSSRSQLYSSILTPLLFLLILGVGVSEGLKPTALSDGDFKAYLVAGTAVMAALFSASFSAASYYRDKESGFLRVLLVSPLPARTVIVGKSISGAIIGTAQSLVVIAVAAPLTDLGWQHGVVPGLALAVAVILLLNLTLAGLAAALATRIRTMQGFHLVMNLGLFPLLFVSGAFFPIEGLPAWLRLLSWINPLTYAVDGLQQAIYATTASGYIGLGTDFAVLVALVAVALAGGLARRPRVTWSGE